MEEYHALAVAAVEALQLATQPKWTEIVAASVGIIQCILIAWGIRTMGRSAELRDQAHERRHQETMRVLQQQGEALTQVGAGIQALLRRAA